MATENRYDHLLVWMDEHGITFSALGEKLSISASGARRLCVSEFIPSERHRQLLDLGFPFELLPLSRDRKRGRAPRTPIFPGMLAGQEHGSQSVS